MTDPGATGPTQAPPSLTPFERRLVVGADRFVYWLTNHWLLAFSGAALLFLALAYASPVLIATGHERLGGLIFMAYHRVCHQLPERSFFVMGQQVAFCQRDVGVYAGLVAGGGLFALSGRRPAVRRLLAYGLVFALPVALDGLTQLVGVRQSNWYLRLGTGVWFGLGTALLAYPVIGRAMAQTHDDLHERFGPGLERLRRPHCEEVCDGGDSALP